MRKCLFQLGLLDEPSYLLVDLPGAVARSNLSGRSWVRFPARTSGRLRPWVDTTKPTNQQMYCQERFGLGESAIKKPLGDLFPTITSLTASL